MAKYKKNQKPNISDETIAEAEAVAKATQRPGQSKEQTKLIAQGIQKGIEEYKKRQKTKARELDKKLKKVRQQDVQDFPEQQTDDQSTHVEAKQALLPWILLGLSWAGFAGYVFLL